MTILQKEDRTAIGPAIQNGPIAEAGAKGVTQEVLLVIIADRLRSFQAGPYACKANACALTKIEEGELHFLARTNPSREWIFAPGILPHMIDRSVGPGSRLFQ